MTQPINFSEFLRQRLRERGVSAARAAREMGLSEAALRNYVSKEDQQHQPSERVLTLIANYFNVDRGLLATIAGRGIPFGTAVSYVPSEIGESLSPPLRAALDEFVRWAALQSDSAQGELARYIMAGLSLYRNLTSQVVSSIRSEAATYIAARGTPLAEALGDAVREAQ